VGTGTFNQRETDAVATLQEISRWIANALKWKLGRGARRYDPDAYELYLRALAAVDVRFPGDDDVINLFEQAIGSDRSMAPAYAGLAMAYAFRSSIGPFDASHVDGLDKMRAAAERAVQLDPLLAEAQGAQAMAHAHDGRWDLAERSFRRAIQIDPSLSITRYAFARFLLCPLGRMDEALRQARAGAENDPLSPRARYELAGVLLAAGR